MNALDIVVIDSREDRLETVYRDLLAPSFPPDQLDTQADLREAMEAGQAHMFAVFDADGRALGAAVAEWYGQARVLLLAYLAVEAAHRSRGLGGRLLETALAAWTEKLRPDVVVAEIEDPSAESHHPEHPEWGDPARRTAFYARHGARVIDLPYFQPALRPDSEREHEMLLITLDIAPPAQEGTCVAADPIRRFLHAYFTATEGQIPDDDTGAALMRAAAGPQGIALIALSSAHAVSSRPTREHPPT